MRTTPSDRRGDFVQTVVTDIQIAAGAAPYATLDELVDIFTSVADRVPEPTTQVDRMVLRRLLANVTRHLCRHPGADLPIRPVVNRVADADDPKVEFRRVLTALRRSDPPRRRSSS